MQGGKRTGASGPTLLCPKITWERILPPLPTPPIPPKPPILTEEYCSVSMSLSRKTVF